MSSLSTPLTFFLGADDDTVATAVVTVDHVRNGLARLCLQFRSARPMDAPEERTNMEKLLAVLLRPFNDLELALQQLIQLRSLPIAVGIQLDVIGDLLGQKRAGLADEDYRRYLFARIATNRAAGRRRDLIKIAKLILNDVSSRVVITNLGPAAATVQIESSLLTDGLAAILLSFLASAAAAGVRLTLLTSPDALADQFAFSCSAFPPSPLTSGATAITVDSTADFPPIGSLVIDTGLAVEETVGYAGTTATSFTLLAPLAHNHLAHCDVQLIEPATGKGFGDSTEGTNLVPYSIVGTTGGTLIDAREATP
jgi:hypothetical protein